MPYFFLDIKYALRLLFNAPKFTAMTLAVLVGGLSIALFTYSFLYTLVYKPLPIPEANTAKSISTYYEGEYRSITAYEYLRVKDQINSFAEFGIYDETNTRLSFGESGKSLFSTAVQTGFFEFSRTKPVMGRTFQPLDYEPGATPVAVISYETWQNELNGEEQVLDKTVELNGVITNIIGVMPEGYHFPSVSRVWLPLAEFKLNPEVNLNQSYKAYGRVKPNLTVEQAENELGQAINQIYSEAAQLYDLPQYNKKAGLLSFQLAQTGGEGGVVFTFLNIVSWLILLLACINVGNLLLARTIERQKETAIRAALGAQTSRLVSQLMWEGIIISCLGGVMALLLVGAALHYTDIFLRSWMPGGGSYWWRWGMDLRTFGMGIGFTLVTIILSSFVPAWRSANQDINSTLRDGTRGAQSKKAGRLSVILVTTQIFLVAVLMLVGSVSGFIAQKFINLDMGDDYSNVMNARMTIPVEKYPQESQQLALFESLKEKLEQHPNIEGVVAKNWQQRAPIMLEGMDYASEQDKPLVDTVTVIGETDTVGVELVAGRQFNHSDKLGNRNVALISQSMAKRYWPSESPLEKSFKITYKDKTEKLYIVGVVTDRLNPTSIFGRLDAEDEIYISGQQFISNYQSVYYRIMPNTANAEEIFYRAMFDVDNSIQLTYSVQLATKNRNLMRESMQLMSDVTFGTGFFALLLAMVGIYGLTANSVAQRTHEVGVRRALGATDNKIIFMFLRRGGKQLFIGIGLALVVYALISFGFHNFTEGLFPIHTYPTLAVIVTFALSCLVMLAIYVPTKKAVKMEPSAALRHE